MHPAEHSPADLRPSTGLWSSTYLLKPGLMRDSPGIFLFAGKAEPAALFFLGLGSASDGRRDRESKRSAGGSGSPAGPSEPGEQLWQPQWVRKARGSCWGLQPGSASVPALPCSWAHCLPADAPHTSGAAALSQAPPGPGRALTAVRAAATAEEAQDPGGLPVPAAS